MMKILISTLFLTVSISNALGQNNFPTTKANDKSFPTNIQEGSFKELKKYNGKVVAFDGTIDKIENSRKDTPFYRLKIADNYYLWTTLMFTNDKNIRGDKIRVVGYLSRAKPTGTEKQYLDGKFMVIAFGLVDFQNSNLLFLGGAEQQKQDWIDGKIPSAK